VDDDSTKAAQKGKKDVDASMASISKDAKEKDGKSGSRARARSIWGRSKK
jgi:hypothetical protein